ncbi:MAG TPA: terminase family protein [Caulobacteraceae bacterium]
MSWLPLSGPQTAFVLSDVFEVIYGGARGGGKTDGVLGEFSLHAQEYGADARGLLVRRTRTALEPTIARAKEIYRPCGAGWREAKSRFEWPSGAVLYFRHLDNDSDADLYQGHSYTRVYVEELTQFPRPGPIDKLKATLRSAAGVRCGFRATCNPGGGGHAWVKARYIDAGAHQVVREPFHNPFDKTTSTLDRVFIPARLTDNPMLLENDPGYVGRLRQSGSEALVKAWLEGDWNAVLGAFFDKWSNANIIAPFVIPHWWTRFRSFDWGHASPFSVGWWAVASDDFNHAAGVIPRGAMVRYREWYGVGRRGEGLRLDTEAIAEGILELEAGEIIAFGVADPSLFNEAGGPSLAERYARCGAHFRRADNSRIPRAGAMSGWDQMRARIRGDGARPMLYVFDTCRDFIRTVPVLQHDPDRLEDLDTRSEDHIADEARYACMARPLIATPPKRPGPSRHMPGWGPHIEEPCNWKTM